MYIKVRNARCEMIAGIVIENGTIEEDKCQGCWVSDMDMDDNGEPIYRVDLIEKTELLQEFSNEELLREIQSRMHS